MAITRRGFLALGGGLIASATMTQAGAFAEYMDWMKRKPVFSFPPYRPSDGPELFIVTRSVNGVPIAFNGPFYSSPQEFAAATGLYYSTAPLIPKRRIRPLPGFVREGDVLDYCDLRTMPPPSESARQGSDEVRRSILSAYDAECSGDEARIVASMSGYKAWS